MQKHVNLVDLVKSFPTNIFLQNLASIQKSTGPIKFAHLIEKSGKGSMSNLSQLRLSPLREAVAYFFSRYQEQYENTEHAMLSLGSAGPHVL